MTRALIAVYLAFVSISGVTACGLDTVAPQLRLSKRALDHAGSSSHVQYVSPVAVEEEIGFKPRQHRRQTANAEGDIVVDAFQQVKNFDPIIKDLRQELPPPPIRPVSIPNQLTQQDIIRQIIPTLNAENIKRTTTDLSNLQNRWFNSTFGVQASDMVFAKAQEIARASPRKDVISVRRVRVSNLMQYNIVVQIRGRSEKTMIVGSHLDSINNEATKDFTGPIFVPDFEASPGIPITFNPELSALHAQSRAPGADDDASGVATTLEIFRALSLSPHPLTLTWEFHFYAAEEVGLLGSIAVAIEWVKTQRRDITAYLNLDMTAFVPPGSEPAIGLFKTGTDEGLSVFAERVVREYVGIRTTRFEFPEGSSDHASWFKTGIPTVMPFESAFVDNKNFHTFNDTVDKLNFTHAAEIGRLCTAMIIELDAVGLQSPQTNTNGVYSVHTGPPQPPSGVEQIVGMSGPKAEESIIDTPKPGPFAQTLVAGATKKRGSAPWQGESKNRTSNIAAAFSTANPRFREFRETALNGDGDIIIDAFEQIKNFNEEIKFDVGELPDTVKLPTKPDLIRQIIPTINTNNIRQMTTDLSNLHNRWFNSTFGVQASDMVFARAHEIAQASPNKNAITVRRVRVNNLMQYNVVAQIRGRSTKTMIVGSHLDTINEVVLATFEPPYFDPDPFTQAVPFTVKPDVSRGLGEAPAPGADDNASGVATNLEIFRVLAASKLTLEATWEFHFYAAEELGAVGSMAVAIGWVHTQKRDIAAYVNLDMTAFVPLGAVPTIGLWDHSATNPDLNAFAEAVAAEYIRVPTKKFTPPEGYGSDQASWVESEDDTVNRLNFTHAAELGRLAIAMIIELDAVALQDPKASAMIAAGA
ncbi:Leucine aminopeptidase 1 [Quaeritorhiza haematococci]|nr:Leucine aminopeptidase 1 [Quaeritorhiza haematococci]